MEKKTTRGRSKATTKETRPKAKPGDKRIGNEFWKFRSKHGRDTLFSTPEILWEAACEYFQWVEDNPLPETKVFQYQGKVIKEIVPIMRAMTMQQLCFYLKCDESYFRKFKERLGEDDKGFFTVITDIENIIYTQKFQGAAGGLLVANLISRELGLVDKKEIEVDAKLSPEERTERIAALMAKMNELNG
ncbi:DNA-packaging protein [Elizabethkingia anophelis]|uniref:terminase small subunit n=1 Tax=Elizabethkingia anophelis TaxID=1117645 RepID=UPI00293C1CA6|nr:DNA-packaging protein [Elizabethkingia anophelis]MDV3904933.1 DNA-packaging protein [Elizabethkingia anophelis]